MSRKRRDFILTSHCLLNPHCRVHILGKNFILPSHIYQYLLSHNIGVIQLPCPEFTAMGYWRNPQGRQQYNNVFFRKHCENVFQQSWLMTQELLENNHRLIGYIGV